MPPSSLDLSLESKLAFLRQPSSYRDSSYRVEAIETHMSWVFLTDRYAYKLKKPVCYEFLDFRTLAARKFYCEEEIRLNRRLAPAIYLGTVPLTIDDVGHLQLGQDGAIADWLVKMHRIPADQMLDYRIKSHSIEAEDAFRIISLLVAFYRDCQPIALTVQNYLYRLERELKQNMDELSLPAYRLPAKKIQAIYKGQITILQRLQHLLAERVHSGKIIEGHGDLRPEHVCIGPETSIIDCLEFSLELRTVDRADEVAFLALECERLGATHFADLLLRNYQMLSGDTVHPAIIHFYQSARACTRAKITIRHLNEERYRYSAEWPRRAMDYLTLADRHIEAAASQLPAS